MDFASRQDPTGIFVPVQSIGIGSFGEVYKGRCIQSGELVAIKIINIPKTEEFDGEQEIDILRKFSQHVNIITFHGAFLRESTIQTKDDVLWLVMEFCGGGSIFDLLEQVEGNRLKEDWIAYICKGILKGLAYLHSNHIIHGDIKAENIMVNDDAKVKLVDFGLSTQLNEDLEQSDIVWGTAQYMAPEMFACMKDPLAFYDYRVDVWACGITTIAMAEGSIPYQTEEYESPSELILQNPPPELTSPCWTKSFISFVESCLMKNFNQRPSAQELLSYPFIRNQPNESNVQQEIKQHIFNTKMENDGPSQEGEFGLQMKIKEQQCSHQEEDQSENTTVQEPIDDGWREDERLILQAQLEEERRHLKELQEQIDCNQAKLLTGEKHRAELAAYLRLPLLSDRLLVPRKTTRLSRLQCWFNWMKSWFPCATSQC